MTTSAVANNWIKELKVSQLKMVLGAKAIGCTEKGELEALVVESNMTHEEVLLKVNQSNTMEHLKRILGEDRGVVLFSNYTPSRQHMDRMEHLQRQLPRMFDNPDLTPRTKWLSHRNWHRHPQMPPYHVHFRQEMQDAMRFLHQAHAERSALAARQALRMFQGCMRGLNGHVSIEEYAVFPQFQERYPNVDMKFLYEDHQHLHQAEEITKKALSQLVVQFEAGDASPENTIYAIDALLIFDQQLMAHLAEEEEFIVPMTLATDEPLRY